MAESSIAVAVRVRPFSPKETALLAPQDTYQPFLGDGGLSASGAGAPSTAGPSTFSSSPAKGNTASTLRTRYLRPIVRPIDDKVLIFDPLPDGGFGSTSLNTFGHGSKKPRDIRYAFDRVFDERCSQDNVFEKTTKPLLDGILNGFNASVFAYGVSASASVQRRTAVTPWVLTPFDKSLTSGHGMRQDTYNQRHAGGPRCRLSHNARAVPSSTRNERTVRGPHPPVLSRDLQRVHPGPVEFNTYPARTGSHAP